MPIVILGNSAIAERQIGGLTRTQMWKGKGILNADYSLLSQSSYDGKMHIVMDISVFQITNYSSILSHY